MASINDAKVKVKVEIDARDAWAHRSNGMTCKTCIWYVPKAASILKAGPRELGRCRRHAPRLTGYPAVFSKDWCGDHKLDENKI